MFLIYSCLINAAIIDCMCVCGKIANSCVQLCFHQYFYASDIIDINNSVCMCVRGACMHAY